MTENTEPDLIAEYLAEDPRQLTDTQRRALAAELGLSRAALDELIERLGAAFDAISENDIDPGAHERAQELRRASA